MKRLFVSKTQFASIISVAFLRVTLIAMPGLAQAATLYVATYGNNSNPGTSSRPFATISAAASAALPGTDIIVRGGTYLGRVSLWTSGSPSAYIRYCPYGGERVIIDGTGTPSGQDLVVIGGNYVEFRGFEVRNATSAGIDAWTSNHVRIIGNIVHDSYGMGIFSGSDTAAQSYSNVIDMNTVYHNSLNNITRTPGIIWAHGIMAWLSDNTVITGNVSFENYGEGIGSTLSTGVTISGNTVFDNYSVEIYLNNAPSSVVTGNLVYSTGNSSFFWQGHQAIGIGAAIETEPTQMLLKNETITNNIVIAGQYGIYYGNFDHGGGMQNSLIANNTVVNATDAAIHIDPDSHRLNQVVNNVFYRSPPGTLKSGSPTGFSFGNNCWFGGTAGSFAGTADVFADPLLVQPRSFSAGGYKISSASPCLASGRVLTQVTVNFWGTSRAIPYSSGAY